MYLKMNKDEPCCNHEKSHQKKKTFKLKISTPEHINSEFVASGERQGSHAWSKSVHLQSILDRSTVISLSNLIPSSSGNNKSWS